MLVNSYAFKPPVDSPIVALIHVEDSVVEVTGVSSVSLAGSTAVSATQSKFGSKSLFCPGTGQNTAGIRLAHAGHRFVFPDLFTMEGWFYPTSLSGFLSIFDGQRNFSASGSWTLQSGSGGFLLPVISGNFSTGPNASSAIVTNAWQHVAWTRDASNVQRIFVDGVLKASATHAGTIGAQDSGSASLNISRGIASDNGSFIGYVEEIRIAKACFYDDDFTPPSAPFDDP